VNIITYLVLIQTILSFKQKKSRKNGHLHVVPPLIDLRRMFDSELRGSCKHGGVLSHETRRGTVGHEESHGPRLTVCTLSSFKYISTYFSQVHFEWFTSWYSRPVPCITLGARCTCLPVHAYRAITCVPVLVSSRRIQVRPQ